MSSLVQRIIEFIGRRGVALWVVVVCVAVPLAFIGSAVANTDEPSFDPTGEVFDIEDRVDDVFADPDIRSATFLVDRADGGNALGPEVLGEIAERSAAARSDATHADHLVTAFDFDMNLEIPGLTSIAGSVADALGGTIDPAAPEATSDAVSALLEPTSPVAGLRFSLSEAAAIDEDGDWSSPAFLVHTRYDVNSFDGTGDDDRNREAERWLRDLQADLSDNLVNARLIGVGIDGILTGEEQVSAGAPFIFLAVALIVLLVAGLLRSYWAATIAAAAIGSSLVLYGTIVALAGLSTSSSLIVFVVPMTLIAFGVDFFVHAAERIRERTYGHPDEPTELTYSRAIRAVAPALALAAATSIAAFASNGIAGIEAIVQFGVAASIGLAIAFVMLGMVAPRALLAVETASRASAGLTALALRWIGRIVMALAAGIVVSIAAAAPAVGAVALVIFIACFVVLPKAIRNRRTAPPGATVAASHGDGGTARALTKAIETCARRRRITLAGFALVATAGGIAATQVEAAFEVSDFFSTDSDFIIGLDRNDQHFASVTGGPAYIYVEGDLDDPTNLRAIASAIDGLRSSDAALARNADGDLVLTPNAVAVVRSTMASPPAIANIEAAEGIALDDDGDAWPDNSAAADAIFRSALARGVTAVDGTTVFTPETANLAIAPTDDGYATRLQVIVTTFTDDELILEARDDLEAVADDLAAAPGSNALSVGVSGEVIASQESLAAFTRAMVLSLPVALLLTTLIVGWALRSVRFSGVSLVPILVVVVTVWGYMALRGFTINVVTATIAAIAVGVGIDFCTHFTVRYRDELALDDDPSAAVRRTAGGTGGALAVSALTSVLGFGVMALAPAPIFSSFGELMAVMILLSAAAALFVLPALLVLVSRRPSTAAGQVAREHRPEAACLRASPIREARPGFPLVSAGNPGP